MSRAVRCPAHVDPGPGRAAGRVMVSTVVAVLVLLGYLAWIALVAWVMP